MADFPDLETAPAAQILAWAMETYGEAFAIATSFQKEGMVIVDMAARIARELRVNTARELRVNIGPRVFTLETGRLPAETHGMIEIVRERYGIGVEIVPPDADEVRELVSIRGENLFYESVESRLLCCDVRKVRPLERKLASLAAWATGIRRGQSETRALTPKVEPAVTPVKINPLADWSEAQVEQYTREHGVPVHPLYALGYASIGCAPCTRAIEPGEDPRAGRWWWEHGAKKECGIHFDPDGKVRRAS